MTKYSDVNLMFKVLNECSMDIFYSCKFLQMLPRKEAARNVESEILSPCEFGSQYNERLSALEHLGSSLHGLGA